MNFNLLESYLSALLNPKELMGDFLADFESDGTKVAKSIQRTKYMSRGIALLELILDDPSVISYIENLESGKKNSLLKIATYQLNQQSPIEHQINTEDTDTSEMINALKIYIKKDIYFRNKKENQRKILDALKNLGIDKFDYHRKYLGDSFPYDEIINHLKSLVGSMNQLLEDIIKHKNE